MKRIRLSLAGLMTLVAVLALDFATLPALRNMVNPSPRLGFLGAILMANVLAVDLAVAVSSLVRRREVALSHVTFLLFGGVAILFVLAIANLAPYFFYMYLDNTAGLWVPKGQSVSPLFLFGLGGSALVAALLTFVALAVPVLLPALLAAWITRGYRLKLIRDAAAEGVQDGTP